MLNNRRQNSRVNSSLPIDIQVDSQITIKGQIRDISDKSAFVILKSGIFLQLNDEFVFLIKITTDNLDKSVTGKARISRIEKGEGIAIYFTQMDDESSLRLRQLLGM